jgi:hypothetical protein
MEGKRSSLKATGFPYSHAKLEHVTLCRGSVLGKFCCSLWIILARPSKRIGKTKSPLQTNV